MPRPVKRRRICELPSHAEFAPIDDKNGEIIEMTLDEYEAVRLIDLLDFSQEDCAQRMEVARTTAQSVYISARKKMAEALVNGKRLRIAGGAYRLCPKAKGCCGIHCHRHEGDACCAIEGIPSCARCMGNNCPGRD